ncbi:glucokinase [Chenggangzhangella methanolivorans]|uniref:Glucokinase n=1 Tax=Chenggangzhangella methanolivorans TaxID=1437009 RepID=A0A9E6UGE7_9HYPH|nr:glucokinase [Chenggangzhangella methanolivorans]QZN98652.1 glucokinase [Chenggangzhangella methanolivorans]
MAVLVGDIGGTNGRFGLAEKGGLRPDRIDVEPGDDHASFEDALGAYLEKTGEKPDRAALAVAGPVDDEGRARITNRKSWTIDPQALKRRFGFSDVLIMNDFVAQAASLPHLQNDETILIGDARPRRAVKAAVGPGTGLGVASLVPEGDDGWRPLPSEGGHIEFAAVDAHESAAFGVFRRRFGRVSAEYVVSGPGLARLHDALAEVEGRKAPGLDPAAVTKAALDGDPEASATAALFLTMLARFAGDMALSFGAKGGVYLCGGVAPRLVPALDVAAFRAAFDAKSPHEEMMRATATAVVTSPIAGLIGASAMAARGRV